MGRRGPTPKREWKPLVPHTVIPNTAAVDPKHAAELAELAAELEMWGNDRYMVIVERTEEGWPFHLSLRRLDRKPIRDWRDMQRIKNQLCGDEAEAIELYPAESRLVDEANQFHLWCLPEGEKVSAGYDAGRSVAPPEEAAAVGGRQRPLD